LYSKRPFLAAARFQAPQTADPMARETGQKPEEQTERRQASFRRDLKIQIVQMAIPALR
jgi:hypothetical protein